jgi:hypothetical protein
MPPARLRRRRAAARPAGPVPGSARPSTGRRPTPGPRSLPAAGPTCGCHRTCLCKFEGADRAADRRPRTLNDRGAGPLACPAPTVSDGRTGHAASPERRATRTPAAAEATSQPRTTVSSALTRAVTSTGRRDHLVLPRSAARLFPAQRRGTSPLRGRGSACRGSWSKVFHSYRAGGDRRGRTRRLLAGARACSGEQARPGRCPVDLLQPPLSQGAVDRAYQR